MGLTRAFHEFVHFTEIFLRIMWRIRSIVVFMSVWLAFCAVIIMFVEKISFGNALYFSFVTGFTIGYGDIVMKTPAGQALAILIGLTGIIFTGVIVAIAIEATHKVSQQSKRDQ